MKMKADDKDTPIREISRILVVDDADVNRELIRGLLTDFPLVVDTAESGEEALELIQASVKETGLSALEHLSMEGSNANTYALILLDLHLPGIDGVETLHTLKKIPGYRETPVICLTGEDAGNLEEMCLKEGFTGCMRKPVVADILFAMLQQYFPQVKIELVQPEIESAKEELPDWLLKVSSLQIEKGLRQCGTADDYLQALHIFANSIERKADEIAKLYHAGDWQEFTNQAHSLKSMARQVGAEKLAELAEKLEKAGNANDIETLRQNGEQLLTFYRDYLQTLDPLLEHISLETDGDQRPVISEAELADAYQTLLELAECYDYDSILLVLDELKSFHIPKEAKNKFLEVWSAASQPDWHKLREVLGEKNG